MDISTAIDKIITEHGSATILRDHLALIRDQAKTLLEEKIRLEKRVAELEDLCRKLASELKAKAGAEEFVEHRGALFKRRREGGYHLAAYCPVCHSAAGALIGEMPFSCGKRHWSSAFPSEDLAKIIAELPI